MHSFIHSASQLVIHYELIEIYTQLVLDPLINTCIFQNVCGLNDDFLLTNALRHYEFNRKGNVSNVFNLRLSPNKKRALFVIDNTESALTCLSLPSLARCQQNNVSAATCCQRGPITWFYSFYSVFLGSWNRMYTVDADRVYQTEGSSSHQGIQPRSQLCFVDRNHDSIWR